MVRVDKYTIWSQIKILEGVLIDLNKCSECVDRNKEQDYLYQIEKDVEKVKDYLFYIFQYEKDV